MRMYIIRINDIIPPRRQALALTRPTGIDIMYSTRRAFD